MGCHLYTVEVKDFADGWIKVMETVSKDYAYEEGAYWTSVGHASRVTTEFRENLPEHPTLTWYGPSPRYGSGEDGN